MAKKTTKTQIPNITDRPPVVVVMGHIDHGKSTLLDCIRKTKNTDLEAGGITQHISAYEIEHIHNDKKRRITFLDTPGHAAFNKIRTRGATVADIAILVVSAEDGVKPQTLEALKAIKEAKLPFVVAINKIDKPNANVEKTKQNLAENDVFVEGYGGDVPWVAISAKTGVCIPELLDLMLLVADMAEFKGDTNSLAEGSIIESNIDSKKGISATLIIKNGTLTRGECIVAGDAWAPVRIFEDTVGNKIDSATFSSPVNIIGWNKLPKVGSLFITVTNKKEAELLTQGQTTIKTTHPQETANSDKIIIPIIIKTDAMGSLEGIEYEIKKIDHPQVAFTVVQSGIGPISESDVKVAQGAPNCIILGFNVKTDGSALTLADRAGIPIETFDIIYKLSERLSTILQEKTPAPTEEIRGLATVIKVFSKQKDKIVLGARIQEGTLKVGENIRIKRNEIEIGNGKIKNLQHMKADIDSISDGKEFGTHIESKVEIENGDIIESVKLL